MTDYNYNVDLSTFNIEELHTTIQDTLTLSTESFHGISTNTSGNVLITHFSGNITSGEKTNLDGIISSHTPTTTFKRITSKTITPTIIHINSNSYKLFARIFFEGTKNVGEINAIETISYMDNGVTSYNIDVVCRTTNKMIAGANFTNTSIQTNNLGSITNVPENECLLDFSAKITKNGNATKYAHIDSIIIWYNNKTI